MKKNLFSHPFLPKRVGEILEKPIDYTYKPAGENRAKVRRVWDD